MRRIAACFSAAAVVALPVAAFADDAFVIKHDESIQILRERAQFVPPSRLGMSDRTWMEGRSNIKVTCADPLCANDSITLKPRITKVVDHVSSPADETVQPFRFLEAYGRAFIGDTVTVSAGKEVLGWGPGLLFSPTNRLFPDNGLATPRREIPGKRMVVASEALANGSTVGVLAARADDAAWNASENEKSHFYLIRFEHQDDEARPATWGLVAGGGDKYQSYGGFYYQVLIDDAWTVGTEWSASKGYARHNPLVEGADTGAKYDAVANIRYGLDSGGELALEVARNGFSIDHSRYQNDPGLLVPLLPGAPVPAIPRHPLVERYYVLCQARLPKLAPAQKTTLFSRVLWAPESGGGMAFAEWSYAVDDALEFFVGYTHTFGPADSSFRLLVNQDLYFGLKLYL